MARIYQPSLLRLLHGATALLVPLAWLTGLVVYSCYDGRFGRLPWFDAPGSVGGGWIDIHGTVGVLLWPIALLFGLYALGAGRARLRQPARWPAGAPRLQRSPAGLAADRPGGGRPRCVGAAARRS
jgi:hypothetical protein